MKKTSFIYLALALGILAVFASSAFAASIGVSAPGSADSAGAIRVFNGYSGASSTERFSSAIYVRGFRKIGVQVSGITKLGNYSGLSGTVALYGGNSETGRRTKITVPPSTVASWTADTAITIDNAFDYLWVSWTRTRNALDAWITPVNIR